MKLLSWNVQGIGPPITRNHLRNLLKQLNPDVTKSNLENMEKLARKLAFSEAFYVPRVGLCYTR